MLSVCLATYNGEKYIKSQIVSILNQLKLEDEIIVSDDGSEDNTLKIIHSFNDKRIIVITNQSRHGVVSNFENAIKYASGEYVFLCDQDDIWSGNKIDKCLKELKHVDLIVHNSLIMDGDGNISDMDFFSLRHSKPGYWKNLYKNSFIGCCMAFRRDILNYILPFPTHILWHDMWIGLMVEKRGRIKFIDDKLLYYRRHENNVSATAEKSTFSFCFQIKYRLQMLYYTTIR